MFIPQSGAASTRYPVTSPLYPYTVPTSSIDTSNVLTHPEGPEFRFTLDGEGEYVLKDDLLMATPPPHPADYVPSNVPPNPLATAPLPETAGTKITLVNLDNLGSLSPPATFTATYGPGTAGDCATAFTDLNALLAPSTTNLKDVGKKKKPRSSMPKSNSSFMSRVILHDSLDKKLKERKGDELFCFTNINRAFQWLDLSAESEKKAEYLAKILFTRANCLCHDVNPISKLNSHCDLIMGFNTSDLIWWEPISQRYSRINKNGVINPHPVVDVHWIPGSEQFFLAAHRDGSLVVYDKEKEDSPFVPEESESVSAAVATTEEGGAGQSLSSQGAQPSKPHNYRQSIVVLKSITSKNQAKANPVAFWKVAHMKINAIAFSPDCRHLAMAFDDGSVRILDYLAERLVKVFHGYFGASICVCWSPDGRFLVTGGQDDLLHVWDVAACALVAYGDGHKGWVNKVVFDPWACDAAKLRLGSIGDDCRICLWDLDIVKLAKPPQMAAAAPPARPRSFDAQAQTSGDDTMPFTLQPQSRTTTPMLVPVASAVVDMHPLQSLAFTRDAVMISCKSGHIRTWLRPSFAPSSSKVSTTAAAAAVTAS